MAATKNCAKHRAAQAKYVAKNRSKHNAAVKRHYQQNKGKILARKKSTGARKASKGGRIGRPRSC
jgi:hypothetical protein